MCLLNGGGRDSEFCVRSEKITDALLSDLEDKNWKVRNEALQKIVGILNDAKFITANIGELPEALHARLGDSNKNLVGNRLHLYTSFTLCWSVCCVFKMHLFKSIFMLIFSDVTFAVHKFHIWVSQLSCL